MAPFVSCLLALAVDYQSFVSTAGLNLAGSARTHGDVLRLVPARGMQAGAAWLQQPQAVAGGFETEFVFRFTEPDRGHRGADGLAFVIQNSGPDAVAGVGRSGGFAMSTEENGARGISRSLAVFFDTYENDEEDDPSGNYVSFCVTGDGYWPRRRLHHSGKRLKVRLEDGREHRARILYTPPRLAVYVDDDKKPVLEAALHLAEIVESTSGRAWVGFTASTGGGWENHDVLRWRFITPETESKMLSVESRISFGGVGDTRCAPGHTLCTPAKAAVEEAAAGRWRVVLPANAAWSAAVPATRVRIAQATGVVCWSPDEGGRPACNGPEGAGRKADRQFVSPGQAAGGLVMEVREGRTVFSVNDRQDAFADNEGFFELEVEELR